MSDNILAGLQVATQKPSMHGTYVPTWSAFSPAASGVVKFSGPTRFIADSVITFEVTYYHDNISNTDTFSSKDKAFDFMGNKLEDGYSVSCRKRELTPAIDDVIKGRKLQYRVLSGVFNNNWNDLTRMSNELTFNGGVEFRIRPDYFHVVTTISITSGSITFEDIEDLAKYVDKRIRTNGLDFYVRKVKY
jgi:hypothetical protein